MCATNPQLQTKWLSYLICYLYSEAALQLRQRTLQHSAKQYIFLFFWFFFWPLRHRRNQDVSFTTVNYVISLHNAIFHISSTKTMNFKKYLTEWL